MKGIILAGGKGTRLYPLTKSVTKQLLPIYDKPMIYYPLAVLMKAGIREILIISTPEDIPRVEKALGNGCAFGVQLKYCIQEQPNGIAESFVVGKNFIAQSNVCLILGDNIFHGSIFDEQIKRAAKMKEGAIIFAYQVSDPERYGVVQFNQTGKVVGIVEKPEKYISNCAVTGLYFYDATVVEKAQHLTPSARGELEITDIHNLYLKQNKLQVEMLPVGTAWLDAGTYDSLLEAAHYVQVLEKRQGIKIACLEEIAFRNKWVSRKYIKEQLKHYGKNSYLEYLRKLI